MSTPNVVSARCFSPSSLSLGPLGLGHGLRRASRLVIILVVDQFRADYLDRYRADLKGRGLPPLSRQGSLFRRLLLRLRQHQDRSAMPPWARGPIPTVTASLPTPGGTWPATKLALSPRWKTSDITCGRGFIPVTSREPPPQSARLHRRRFPAPRHGWPAKVFGISLKDRAAILRGTRQRRLLDRTLLRGLHHSSYYMETLPDWVTASIPETCRTSTAGSRQPGTRDFYESVGSTRRQRLRV